MDSLGLEKAGQSQAAAALSLYLMTLQVLPRYIPQMGGSAEGGGLCHGIGPLPITVL